MSACVVSCLLRSSDGDVSHVSQQVIPIGVSVVLPATVVDRHGVSWEVVVEWWGLPVTDWGNDPDPFARFSTAELAEEVARRINERDAIESEEGS